MPGGRLGKARVRHQYPESRMGDTGFEMVSMDRGFGPPERAGVLVIGDDEITDGLSQLPRRGETGTLEGGAGQDREPDLHLVGPTRIVRREVEMEVAVMCQPTVAFGLVAVEGVEDDVEPLARTEGDEAVHEVEERDTAGGACRDRS